MGAVFVGKNNGIVVINNGTQTYLSPRKRISDEFCWGRGAICAAETAYCILYYCCGARKAEALHTLFKWDVISKLKKTGWVLKEEWVKKWAEIQLRLLNNKNKQKKLITLTIQKK